MLRKFSRRHFGLVLLASAAMTAANAASLRAQDLEKAAINIDNFAFGPDGLAHKAVFLEGATCMPLEVNVRAGKTTKSARLDFSCEAVPAQK